jgi:uncharacterized protein
MQRANRYKHPWLRALCILGVIGLLVLGATLGWLKWHEDELVFRTAESHPPSYGELPANAERLVIPEPLGSSLAAVILYADPSHDSGFWVLHLHGNAASAFSAHQLRHSSNLRSVGLNVLSFDYRGFGLSPGAASETHMDEDAEAAYQELIRRGIQPSRIILWGHSLGTGPAVVLATQHAVAALVLFAGFTSIPDAAADTYPYLPVRWIVSIHFDSLKRLPDVHIPVVIVHTVNDQVFPYYHAQRLFDAANEPKRLITLTVAPTDGLGGHVDALYDNLGLLIPQLATLVGAPLVP